MRSTPVFGLFWLFAFLRGCMFWYVLEKIFLQDAGLSGQQIVLMGAMRGAVSLLLEIPTGALGDRWGYKKTLALSLLFLAWGGLQYLVADNFANFLLATSIWTASDALASGTLQAYLYGLVKKYEGSGKRYRTFAGRARAMSTFGVMIGSLAGGLMATFWPLWVGFAASVVPVLGALYILRKLPTVVYAKTEQVKQGRLTFLQHGLSALKHVVVQPEARRILLAYVVVSPPMLSFLELSQLHYLSVGLALALFGPADFVRFGARMLGSLVASSRIGEVVSGRRGLAGALALLAALLWALFIWRSPWAVLLLSLITLVIVTVEVSLDARLQQALPGHIRAAATSSVSFVCNLLWCGLMVLAAILGAQTAMFTLVGALAALVTVGGAWVIFLERRHYA